MRSTTVTRALLVLAALAIGACGDSGDDDDTAGEDTQSTSEDTSTTEGGEEELSGDLKVSAASSLEVPLGRAAEQLILDSGGEVMIDVNASDGTDTMALCAGEIHVKVVETQLSDTACDLVSEAVVIAGPPGTTASTPAYAYYRESTDLITAFLEEAAP